MIYDITPPLSAATKVWPGDTPLSREVILEISKGASVTLSAIRSTVHLGAHADGPNHYSADGTGVGERSLDYYIGACQVVYAMGTRGRRVRAEDIRGGVEGVTAPRVLIRTDSFPDPTSWNEDFAALDPGLIDLLHARGVITVGIDTPSVDSQDSKDLPAHNAFLRHDMSILEGVTLKDVPEGMYELIALPLRLMGFDASPVRAILRRPD